MDLMKKIQKKEFLYLGVLMLLLIVEKFIAKDHPHIHWHEFLFFINYVMTGLFIGYYLLPEFLYKRKKWAFACFTFFSIIFCMVIEEFVLEQLFFPRSRGSSFDILFTLYDILPPILIIVGYKFAWDATQKQNKIDKLDKMVYESQLKYLNSQINPHFLFNNLNNLYALALEQSPQTPKIILELSGLLRYMIYDCKADLVPLQKEINHLESFVELNKIQLENRASIQVNNNISDFGFKITPLILIVFVENAFKHSSSSQINKIHISIELKIVGNHLHFSCKNNFTEDSNHKNLDVGIGLQNIKERLDLIYKGQYKLETLIKNQEYCVNLSLPLHHD